MKNFFALALLAVYTQAQSAEVLAAAIQQGCCGNKNLACACAEPQQVFDKQEVCTDRTIIKETTRMVMKTVDERQTRKIEKTVMVPFTQNSRQIKTVKRPVKNMVTKMRTDYRMETQVSWKTVSEDVRIPVPKPSCGCYSTSCGCAGSSSCGCSSPKCGCAPPKVLYSTQTVTKQVPVGTQVRVPVQVPYQVEEITYEDQHILHDAPVSVMRPRIVMEEIEEIVPVYKLVPEVTKTPIVITECSDVLVADGERPVVKQLSYEEVQHTHEGGDSSHNHAGYSNSSEVADNAEPNMHSHAIHTDGLRWELSP